MADQKITIKVQIDERDAVQAAQRIGGEINREFGGADGQVGKATNSFKRFGDQMRDTGLLLTSAVTLPLGIMAKEIIRVGAEYESSMNLFQAATKASAEQMRQAGDVAKKLGADMALPATSAGDAAKAMTELAKGGLTAQQAMDAAKGTLLLAAAAGIKEAEAAEIAANALNVFHLQASEANRVADLLAATANASSAEITDVALAMQQSGASAAALKVPIEDLTTAIGLMANNGIKGSDAGTSLKTAFTALAAPTTKASEEMQRLGLNVFDAQGKMLPMREVVGQISEKFAGLTDQQKLQSAETIFGSDAMRAALIVLGGGVDTFDKLKAQVTASGAAAELAGAKTKGLAGAWEGLKSQLETGALVIFERIGPVLEPLLRQLAEMAGRVITIFEAFAKGNPTLANASIAFVAVAAAIGPVALAIAGLVTAIGTISAPLLAAVAAITAGAAAITAAWSTNFLGIRDVTAKVMTEVRKFANENLDQIVKWWRENLPLIKQTVETVLNAIRAFWKEHGETITAVVKTSWELIKTVVGGGLKVILDLIKLTMQVINGDWTGVWRTIAQTVKDALALVVNTMQAADARFKAILKAMFEGGVAVVRGFVDLMADAGAFLVTGLVEGIKGSANKVVAAAKALAQLLPDWVRKVLGIQSPSTVFKEIGGYVGEGLIQGLKLKTADVTKAAKEIAQGAIKEAKGAMISLAALIESTPESLHWKEASLKAREHTKVLEDILSLRYELGEEYAAQLPKTLEGARSEIAHLKGLKTELANIEKGYEDLYKEEQDLAKARKAWGLEQREQFRKTAKETEQVVDFAAQVRAAYTASYKAIQTESENLKVKLAEDQARIAALTKYAAEFAAAAYQKGFDSIRSEALSTANVIKELEGQNAALAENSAERQAQSYDEATERIRQGHLRATEDIGRAQAVLADNMIFNSDRATASILDHLGRQRNVTETVVDAVTGLYDSAFNKLDGWIDGATKKLGIFGEFLGTLAKGIVHNIANNILGKLFAPGGALSNVISGLGNSLSRLLGGGGTGTGIGGVLSGIFGGGGSGGGGIGGILGNILGGGGAGGGILGGIFGGGSAATGAFSGAIATGSASAAGAGAVGGLGGILGSIGAFATSGLGIATFGIGTAAALVGTYLIKRAKQRRDDEEASGVALQDAIDAIKGTAVSIDRDELKFANQGEIDEFKNSGILQPFKDFINTLKTASVRDSRLTNQVRDLENLFNDLVGGALTRQRERLANAPATTGTGGTDTTDPFAGAFSGSQSISLDVTLKIEQGTDAATKAFVVGAKTKDGRDVVVETVKIAQDAGKL